MTQMRMTGLMIFFEHMFDFFVSNVGSDQG